jgi:hypothetical protein
LLEVIRGSKAYKLKINKDSLTVVDGDCDLSIKLLLPPQNTKDVDLIAKSLVEYEPLVECQYTV